MPKPNKIAKPKKVKPTLGQEDHPEIGYGGGDPLLTPLKVMQVFVAHVRTDSSCQELSDMYILSFLGRTYVPIMSGKNVPVHFQHDGFETAGPVSRTQAERYKLRLKDVWKCHYMIWEKEKRRLAEAPSLHLRAESDDEERPPPTVQALPKPKLDFNSLKFVESLGAVRRMYRSRRGFTLDKPIKVKLTLGYRLLPASFDQGFEICTVTYEAESEISPENVSAIVPTFLTDNETSDSSDSSDSDEIPLPAARKRRSTNNATEVEPKRRART